MGVGHRAFDTVRQVAMECGFPCKLTGAGGGGCAFCLIVPGWGTVCVHVRVCVHVHDQCDARLCMMQELTCVVHDAVINHPLICSVYNGPNPALSWCKGGDVDSKVKACLQNLAGCGFDAWETKLGCSGVLLHNLEP